MDRRQFLFSAGAAALVVPPPGASNAFDVLRDGSKIGEHHLVFAPSPGGFTGTSHLDLDVTVAGISVFSYVGTVIERYAGGQFQSLDSKINFNGDPVTVHAEKVAAGYEVEGTNQNNPAKTTPRYLAPPDTLPLTYWNRAMMNGTILNVQTAHSYRCKVASPGWNALPTAAGGSLTAQRFDLTGKLQISLWYDQNGRWAGLEFQHDGDITYRRQA